MLKKKKKINDVCQGVEIWKSKDEISCLSPPKCNLNNSIDLDLAFIVMRLYHTLVQSTRIAF